MQVTNSANHFNIKYDNFNTLPCVVQIYNFTISCKCLTQISLNEG